jgi:preprotein translocase SecE subunit
MAEMDKADASIGAPPTPSYSDRGDEKVARREHGDAAPQGAPGRIVQFLHDVRAEMKRVSWPNASTVKNTTIITLVAVIFFAVYLFLVDQGMAYLIYGIDWVISKLAGFLWAG